MTAADGSRRATHPPGQSNRWPAGPGHRVGAYLAILLLLLAGGVPAWAQGGPQALPEEPLAIATSERTCRFTVEIADSPDEHRVGLMFRTGMPSDHGMLFLFEEPRIASFWMKNTLIPLDLLFVAADGRIVNIERGEPGSLASIRSARPVVSVLELNAGTVDRFGIEPGHRVLHPFFGTAPPPD